MFFNVISLILRNIDFEHTLTIKLPYSSQNLQNEIQEKVFTHGQEVKSRYTIFQICVLG